MLRNYRADTQQVLDDLYNQHLIPFKLIAQKVTMESPRELRVRFYDSRLHSVVVEIGNNRPALEHQVRAAVLGRLARQSDPKELGVLAA